MAVLLIIIAIALASIVYLFASTQTQSLARTAEIDIIDAKYLSGVSPTALVTVKNTGSVQVTINGITIPGVSCSFGAVSQALNPGTRITIIVQATSITGEQVRAVGQVVAT
jgi:hypothetical protein